MNITKDEARLLSSCIEAEKYDLCLKCTTKEQAEAMMKMLEILIKKLETFSDDKRRHALRSKNSWNDLLRRLIKKHMEKSKQLSLL